MAQDGVPICVPLLEEVELLILVLPVRGFVSSWRQKKGKTKKVKRDVRGGYVPRRLGPVDLLVLAVRAGLDVLKVRLHLLW